MNAQAKLLELREFNLMSVWPRLAMKSKDEFDDYLVELGLLWKNRPCPNCKKPRDVVHEVINGEVGRKKWVCNRAQCRIPGSNRKTGFLKDTFFERCHADRRKVFLLSYLYINDMGTVEEMARSCEMDASTVVQWTTWFRDVLVEYYTSNNKVRMGGPNTVVQVDETNIVRRKYNRGRIVRKDWIIGGIQDGTRMVLCEVTDKRDMATIDSIVQKYVAPGGSSELTSGEGELWDDHFFEALWKWEKNEENLLYEFWKAVTMKNPLV
ncbi:hypothetical protein Q1695_007312 [Nippostrongylus brasiliensis]|nr:hypothetical protein Q1695_007312 [Nippostrongylus brasiliensis]